MFREDIVTKICRNCVYFPESGDIPSHFGRTILSQGHLAPLPLHIIPTYWDHDRALWLYPVPDLVVIGDKFDPFTTTQVIRMEMYLVEDARLTRKLYRNPSPYLYT